MKMLDYTILNIADGPEGTRQTLEVMAQLTGEAQLDPITRSTALRVLNASMATNVLEHGKAVWRWVRRRVRLIDEPIELIHRPEWMLAELLHRPTVDGDCDDAAVLAGSLILALGIPVRFVAVRPAGTANYIHTFVEMVFQGNWYIVDPTVVRIPAGNFDRLVVEV